MTTTDQGIDITKLANAIYFPTADEELLPLVLYRGNWTVSRAKGYFDFVSAMMELGIENIKDACHRDAFPSSQQKATDGLGRDVEHLCGLHKPVKKETFNAFFSRLLGSPSVLALKPGLEDYVRHVISYGRAHGQTINIFPLERISRYSPWSKQAWRKPKPKRRRAKRPVDVIEVPQAYPFIIGTPHNEHEMLMLIDAIVPRGLPRQIREDVCQDLAVEIIVGNIDIGELQDNVGKFVTANFKMHPIRYGELSIDSLPPWDDQGRTLADILSAPTMSNLCQRCELATEELQDGVCESCYTQLEREVAERRRQENMVTTLYTNGRRSHRATQAQAFFIEGRRLKNDDEYAVEKDEEAALRAVSIPPVANEHGPHDGVHPLIDIAAPLHPHESVESGEDKPPNPKKGERRRMRKEQRRVEAERLALSGQPVENKRSVRGARGKMVRHGDIFSPKLQSRTGTKDQDGTFSKRRWNKNRTKGG